VNSISTQEVASIFSSFHIPAKPQILTEIQAELDKLEPDIMAIADLITQDVGLSAAILKIINSPAYGMCRTISEIKQAVMMLGLKSVNSLVTGVMLKGAFQDTGCITLERFWDESYELACAMNFIGDRVKNRIPVEMLFTVGLFLECGIPVLAQKYSDYKEVLMEANAKGISPIELEEKRYQTNHAILGYFVASSWHLPKNICNLILRQHDYDFLSKHSGSEEELMFSVLKASENMLQMAKRQTLSPDWNEIGGDVLDILGITASDYQDVVDIFTDQLMEAV